MRSKSAKSRPVSSCIRGATSCSRRKIVAIWPMPASWWGPTRSRSSTSGRRVPGASYESAIRAVTDKPIRYVINTHMHPDHVFGNAAFKDEAPTFVGHYKLARGLATRAERYLAINKEMLGAQAFEGIEIIVPTLGFEARDGSARSRRPHASCWSRSTPPIPTTTSPSPTAATNGCSSAISSPARSMSPTLRRVDHEAGSR